MTAVDRTVLDELSRSVGDDAEFLRELVETYLDDAPQQIEAIRSGLAKRDVERVHRAAHTLKSSSASIGAMTLAEMSHELEAQALPATTSPHDLDSGDYATRADAIAAELDRVREELDALVPAVAG